jgi:hypothetical protein
VLSGLQTGLLEDIPVEALYSDDAPHGTATQYFLAALVTYTALYGAPAPSAFAPPADLHPLVRARHPLIAEEIAQALGLRDAAALPEARRAGLGLESPALGMGLNGIADWSSQHPFIDIMKTARPWIGHSAEEWGAFPTEGLRAGGYLDAHGWPLALPEGARALEAMILTDQPEGAAHLRGRYLLRYEGEGVLRVTGRVDNVRYDYRRSAAQHHRDARGSRRAARGGRALQPALARPDRRFPSHSLHGLAIHQRLRSAALAGSPRAAGCHLGLARCPGRGDGAAGQPDRCRSLGQHAPCRR